MMAPNSNPPKSTFHRKRIMVPVDGVKGAHRTQFSLQTAAYVEQSATGRGAKLDRNSNQTSSCAELNSTTQMKDLGGNLNISKKDQAIVSPTISGDDRLTIRIKMTTIPFEQEAGSEYRSGKKVIDTAAGDSEAGDDEEISRNTREKEEKKFAEEDKDQDRGYDGDESEDDDSFEFPV